MKIIILYNFCKNIIQYKKEAKDYENKILWVNIEKSILLVVRLKKVKNIISKYNPNYNCVFLEE